MKRLRVAILSHGGVDRVLNQLCELPSVEVVGVFVETEVEIKRSLGEKIKRSILYDGYFETCKKVVRRIFHGQEEIGEELQAVREKQQDLEELSARLAVPYYAVRNYHSPETINLLKNANIDIGILYGTNIIRESVFNIPKRGSINLHQ